MGIDAGQWGRASRASGGPQPGTAATSELSELLSPWEHGRVRPPRRRPLLPVAAGPGAGTGRDEPVEVVGVGFRFTDAPPHRVRRALHVVEACADLAAGQPPGDRLDPPLPHSCLLDLAEAHWGRLGGEVSYAPERVRIDRIAVPATKAASVDQAIRASWPDALPAARLHAWASWMAPQPLEETSGDRFDHLDLEQAAIVTWWWSDQA